MKRDIAPELLKKVLESFDDGIKTSPEFKWALKVMESKLSDYKTAHEFSKEVGRILSDAYKLNITSETLPNGKMYFNIADRVVRPTIEKAHEIVSEYAAETQTQLNYNAGLKIKGLPPRINDDRIYGIVDKLSVADDFNEVSWLLDEPIKNFCQSVVEDTIETNVKHHHKLGLKPKIVRISTGKCCDWCNKLAGTYKYPDVPKDVYRRHLRCDCIVDYHPGDGTKTNVHTKKSTNVEKNSKIEKRKLLSNPKKVTLRNQTYLKEQLVTLDVYTNEKYFIPQNTIITNCKTIAKGKEIRVLRRLVEKYSGRVTNWEKRVGKIESSKYIYDIHWYENMEKQYETKVKLRKEKP